MPKKLSDQQGTVSSFFDDLATEVETMGRSAAAPYSDLSPAEAKAVVKELRDLAKRYFELARKNRSIGS